MNKIKRAICLLLTVITVFGVMAVPASAATNWERGNFANGSNWTTWHTVFAEAKQHWRPNSMTYYTAKTPKIYIYSYKGNGQERKGTTMYVQIQRSAGINKWTTEYDYKIKSGQKITLIPKNAKKKYLSSRILSAADLVGGDNNWRIRVRRYKSNTDVKWWAMKVVNGTL